MKHFNQKNIAILVLVLIMLTIIGPGIIFSVRKQIHYKSIKRAIKQGIPESERTIFSFSLSEYNSLLWIKPQKEFIHKNKFFDVIECVKTTNDSIILSCIDDFKETNLYSNIKKLVSLHNYKKDLSYMLVINSLQIVYLLPGYNTLPLIPEYLLDFRSKYFCKNGIFIIVKLFKPPREIILN